MGIVGQQQGIAPDHFGDIPGNPGLGQTPLPEVGGGNACQLLDLRRHKATGGEGNQFIVFPDHLRSAIHPLHHNGGEFDDLVPAEQQAGGFRVEKHQAVIFGKQPVKSGHIHSPFARRDARAYLLRGSGIR